jgi:hypothetical protein
MAESKEARKKAQVLKAFDTFIEPGHAVNVLGYH